MIKKLNIYIIISYFLMSFITLTNITKNYNIGTPNEIQILKWINLTINKWDFIAVMGASWSWKSTLMNIVGMLDTPSNGEHLINGIPVQNLDENEQALIRRNTIGFVFQWYNLLKKLKARQQVALPLTYMGIPAHERYERACTALKIVGLDDKIDNAPSQLSWWQQQRVCIARALVTNADLILADEPTGALDSKTGTEVMELFSKLHKEQGKTIMLITHDEHIAHYAQKIIHMKDGLFIDNK